MSETVASEAPARAIDSDYGQVSMELCDAALRAKVVQSISQARSGVHDPEVCINVNRLAEISAYINRLEDSLLRHHWGDYPDEELLDSLKQCAGLDIRALAYTMDSMHAEDA